MRGHEKMNESLFERTRHAGFTPDAEATPKRGVSANPWHAGAWLVKPDANFSAVSSGSRGVARRFSVRCDRHKGLTWEWMGARGLALRLRLASASLLRPV
ncbi:unnamed protein product [Pleuronectes platessa]|uniref:Uncharacterized protein n=1 Tax=Pleuronectes platessa TaxID=8262 RepID=A0A9N7Y4X2_PLEPL|nr:unnamed protein product [Pleuronectes platessa]